MRLSSLVGHLAGERVAAWDLHTAGVKAQARGEDVIVLSIGDPDFATPVPVVDAAVASLRAGDTHYTPTGGIADLLAAIADRHQRQSGQPTTPDEVIVLGGAQNALFTTVLCLCEAGDEVIVPEPLYLTYEATVHAARARMVTVPQPRAHGFRLDPAAIEAAVTPRTRAILFSNPCNPTGVVMSRETLEGVADIARRHDLWVIADEVYGALTFDVPHVSIASLSGMADRAVTVSSLSKSHAMTGWRCGWAIGPAALVSHMDHLSLAMLYGQPEFIQRAAVEAFARYDEITGEMRDIYRRRRDLVLAGLSGLNSIRCVPPEGGMFMLIDVADTGLAASDFAWRLFREEGVALLDATAFGPSVAGHVRLSFAAADERLAEACRRITRFTHGIERLAAE